VKVVAVLGSKLEAKRNDVRREYGRRLYYLERREG